MSAICGIYHQDHQAISPHEIDPMMSALAHHGRDGDSVWSDGPIALGRQITHITPQSRRQILPFRAPGLTITADARLDNRPELFDLLRIAHNERADLPDPQLILLAYRKWVLDCPKYLLGDYAFAIWDPSQKRLFCARDYPGVRPFYYYAGPERFIFASDIEALLAHPEVPQALDYAYVAAHLRSYTPFPHFERTFFAKIRKLPPAHALTIDHQGLKIWAAWRPGQSAEIRYANDGAYVERLLELFNQAVSCRLRSAYPVAAHISSGLDSSSVAVLAARALQARGDNLAGGFSWSPHLAPGEAYMEDDERLQVIDICQREGLQPYFTHNNADDIAANLLRRRRIPFTGNIAEADVRRQAQALGVRTLLSGWGGDELLAFNGRGFFLEMFRRGRWPTCLRELKKRADLLGVSLAGGIWGKLVQPWLPLKPIARLRPHGGAWRSLAMRQGRNLPDVFQAEFRAQLEGAPKLQRPFIDERQGVRKFQLALLANGHLTYRIEGWAALGARNGIQYAYPLLDRRIVEFALGLPPEMFMKNGWKRWLFRQSLAGILPDPVRWNPAKHDPAINASHQSRINALHEQVEPQLNQAMLVWLDGGGEFDCLDPQRVRAAIAAPPDPLDEAARVFGSELLLAAPIELISNRALAETIHTQTAVGAEAIP